MQCIWQSLARIPSSGLGRVASVFSSARPSPAHISHHSNTPFRLPLNPNTFRSLNTATSPLTSRPSPLSFFQSTSSPETAKWAPTPIRVPPSRLSLSATGAVHASLKGQALEDAFFIVNSIRYAGLPESQQQHKSWDAVRRSNIYVPPGISPRLPTHALLHGLVRLGLPQQASQLATIMMNSGIRIRGKTLERIVEGLTKPAITKNASSDAGFKQHMESLLGTSRILLLKSSMTSDPDIAFALDLLYAARKSRSQRTGAMFNMLITLCLVNGEIIVASLIFGFLVKEWEFRSQLLTRMTSSQTPEVPEVVPPSKKLDEAYRYNLLAKALQPTPGMLKAIVAPIHDRLAQATPDDLDTPEFQEALQSLANLAALIDKRQLPFPQLSSVIRALSQCPKVENGVWVMGPEQPNFVPAYRYFHGILLRLIESLPTKNPTKRSIVLRRTSKLASIQFKLLDPVHRMQPPLDTPSYNTLMHYALRNRFSPKLAKQVYEHMTTKRNPPLPGNSTSVFNIFLRSATLHRRRDMTTELLEVLQPYSTPDSWEKVVASRAEFSQLPRKFEHIRRSKLVVPPAPAFETILKDNYTLSTYLSSLISCGQPLLVIQLMQELLPVVNLKPRYVSSAITDADRQQKWGECLIRATAFGPHVLGTFLHAIVKHGATKKSHMLFKLIVHAAKASRDPKFIDNPKPWNVSIPIYTMMLQAYKTEFKRFRRRTGLHLLNYLLGKTTILYEMAKQNARQNILGMDKPDPRFFNALLKIFAEYLPVRKGSISEATKHLAQARQQHAKTGFTDDRGHLLLLEEVAEDMEALGYPIPVGFQHLFIGKRNVTLTSVNDSPEVARLPLAFSKPRVVGGPYTLPVTRQKSLPIVRRSRSRRIHSWRRTRSNS